MAAQEGPGTVIVRPAGQDVELLCSVATPGTPQVGVTWIINFNRHGVSSLANGILDGYSADINSSNLIVKNIVMNDNRNNTEYMCVVIMSDRVVNDSDPIFLYVAGEYLCNLIVNNYMQIWYVQDDMLLCKIQVPPKVHANIDSSDVTIKIHKAAYILVKGPATPLQSCTGCLKSRPKLTIFCLKRVNFSVIYTILSVNLSYNLIENISSA